LKGCIRYTIFPVGSTTKSERLSSFPRTEP
jgi:hypothetical protein